MILQIQLPERETALAFHRQRWDEVLQDPRWAKSEDRVETNAFGQVIMTPPADFAHGRRQFRIASLLESQLGGRSLTECPIATADGVKAADTAWFSEQRYEQVMGQRAVELAPEICVEVLSPRNSETEMRVKRQLYFDAGAIECWTCDLQGQMAYYDRAEPNQPIAQSHLCSGFPGTITEN